MRLGYEHDAMPLSIALWVIPRVVAFTSTGDPAAVAPMLAAGASGYLLKGASSEQITAVLESLDG